MGVAIKYKGSTIASMNADGTKTLKTAGRYCEGNIGVEYTAPTPSLISKNIAANGTYNAADDNADGFDIVTVDVPQDPYEVMNDYIEGTLTRLRLNNVPSGRLVSIQPGNATVTLADQVIQRVELPNNTDALGTWRFGHMEHLLLFDSGYTKAFGNVCLYGCVSLRWIIIRNSEEYATLYSNSSISLHSNGRIAVVPSLVAGYQSQTNWSYWADRFRNLYFANSDAEKEALIHDSSVPNESMIVCDYNESYYVKGEGVV